LSTSKYCLVLSQKRARRANRQWKQGACLPTRRAGSTTVPKTHKFVVVFSFARLFLLLLFLYRIVHSCPIVRRDIRKRRRVALRPRSILSRDRKEIDLPLRTRARERGLWFCCPSPKSLSRRKTTFVFSATTADYEIATEGCNALIIALDQGS
jgi:hypothetical protein